MNRPARILSIAGSDSGGGAGIQADIRAITLLGGHGMTAITAITAQNSLGVEAVEPVNEDIVLAQIDAVVSDIGVDAIKIGMLGSAALAARLAERLSDLDVPIVFDPVMVATSGAALADEETIKGFEQLMAVAMLATPNVPELARLTGNEIETVDAMESAAKALSSEQGCAVLAKGGHVPGPAVEDLLVEHDKETIWWRDRRIETRHSHGTGCTLASAIATGLGQGIGLADAIDRARQLVRFGLVRAVPLGQGSGPLALWNSEADQSGHG